VPDQAFTEARQDGEVEALVLQLPRLCGES
jgi:hypothetical protein